MVTAGRASVSTRDELLALLIDQGHEVTYHADSVRGIPSKLLRHREDGRLVITVGQREADKISDKDRVHSLVHGLALAHMEGDVEALLIRVGSTDGQPDEGVLSGLAAMLAAYRGPIVVDLEIETGRGFEAARPEVPDFSQDLRPGKWAHDLKIWYEARPTGLAREIVDRFGDDSLRLYPQLSKVNPSDPRWALRLDGLGVGEVRSNSGWLRIGKKETTQTATQAWGAVTGKFDAITLDTASGADTATSILRQLIRKLGRNSVGIVDHRQPEHSLEAMVLRGMAHVCVDGKALEVPHAESARTLRVAWGSQVPTLWWVGGQARYLDALMRRGSTPYAVELKVQDGGGYGRYLREAITQAVLYRHFIRSTTALHQWTRTLGMEPTQCEAVVAFPKPKAMTPALARRLDGFRGLCSDFDVHYWEIENTGL